MFNLLNGKSYCQFYPTDDQETVKVLSTMDRVRLILKVKAIVIPRSSTMFGLKD